MNLASVLLAGFDLLALDEPTNDLDLAGLALLEDFLVHSPAGFVLISHDRAVLRNLTRATLWIDRSEVRRQDRGFQNFEVWREQADVAVALEYAHRGSRHAGRHVPALLHRRHQVIAIGGEWERYKVKVNAKSLTLSGGDPFPQRELHLPESKGTPLADPVPELAAGARERLGPGPRRRPPSEASARPSTTSACRCSTGTP